MKDFVDLKSLYEYLEENASEYKYAHQIADLFQKLRDVKHRENKPEEVEKAQWEVDFFNFVLENNKIKPTFSGTNDKGEVVKYPSLNRFDQKTYNYLIQRVNSTSNPVLKARYSHILWCSPNKHAKYAKMAVDAYLDLVKIHEQKDEQTPQEHFGLQVLRTIKNAHAIAYQIYHKTENIKSEMRRLVLDFNFQSSSSFALRASLIELMLKGKKKFMIENFRDFENLCWRMAQALTKVGNIHAAIDMLTLGEKVDYKLGKHTHDWAREIAKSYETLMTTAEKQHNSASITFCQLALENYRKIKDQKKTIELQEKYLVLKNSMKLSSFKKEIDLTAHVKKCKSIARQVVKNSPEDIIKLLMMDENLLPKYKKMENIAHQHSKEFVTQHLATTEIIDQRGHTAQHFSEDDEKKYYRILQQYRWEIELNKNYLINEILFAAIRENKLSAETLLKFLHEHSWFGKSISKKLPNQETLKYNWLNLVAPAVNEYFRQMQFYFHGAISYPSLLLCIDSLTLKIEGLLRDICQHSGVTTFYPTKDSRGRNIIREKDIHALLYEESLKKLFDGDELLFFKFLLVEKSGYNLRHKIAHSFMLFEEYTIDLIHLLMLALLRLGKYDFVKKKDSSSTSKE